MKKLFLVLLMMSILVGGSIAVLANNTSTNHDHVSVMNTPDPNEESTDSINVQNPILYSTWASPNEE
ncbi:MAG: hypothetical protein KAX49_09220 [Halanaerobiales bacterium]|nr:hypothetical protein [Halanaerobiales bacterium]